MVESVYLPNDRGQIENALNLSTEILKRRQVEIVDIANEQVDDQDFSSTFDPRAFVSLKTNRGPLSPSWIVLIYENLGHFIIICICLCEYRTTILVQ